MSRKEISLAALGRNEVRGTKVIKLLFPPSENAYHGGLNAGLIYFLCLLSGFYFGYRNFIIGR